MWVAVPGGVKRLWQTYMFLQASPILVNSGVDSACKTGWTVGGKAGPCGCLLAPTPTSHSINPLYQEGRGLRQI